MQTVERTFVQTYNGETRTRVYRVHIPNGGGSGKPMILFAHGHGQSGALGTSNNSAFNPLANIGCVVVFLQGLISSDGDYNWYTYASEIDPVWQHLDEEYVMQVIAAVAAEFGADASQVRMGGFSQGTDMSQHMYRTQGSSFKGFCTCGRGISQAFKAYPPTVLIPWSTTIGEQDESWIGHKDPPTNDADGAVETMIYMGAESNVQVPVPPGTGTPSGNPPNPTTGTKLWTYLFKTPAASGASAAIGAGRVSDVVPGGPVVAGHRIFSTAAGDNFNFGGLMKKFFVDETGLLVS